MQTRIRQIVALVSLPLGLFAGAAQATDSMTCAADLGLVKQAIYEATFYGQQAASNESNLLAKVDSATAKLGRDKPADAIDNLQSVSDKATELVNAPKSKLSDATGINMTAAAAIACIGMAN